MGQRLPNMYPQSQGIAIHVWETVLNSVSHSEGIIMFANTQPFSCNELGPFQAIFGNFQASLGNLLGPFSGDFRRF